MAKLCYLASIVCVQVKIVTEGSTNNVARFYPAVRMKRDPMAIETYPAIARWVPA